MELRERIIGLATELFFRLGIRNVTMDEIALSLGISKRTVYEIFKDKTELVHSCMHELAIQQEQRNEQLITGSGSVVETIFIMMQEGIKIMNSINPVFFSDLKRFYPGIWRNVHEESVKTNYRLMHKMLNKGIEEGLFRKDINIPIVSKLVQEQMNLIADEKVFPRNEFNPAEVFKNMVISFMRGISTSGGIEIIDNLME